MSYQFPPDLQEVVKSCMAAGSYATEDDLLRDALDALAAEREELEAVEAAIAEWRGGDPGRPVSEAFDKLRQSISQTADP
jgi:Arc/MetJ-type ribon-helix-helix transcriptional regulator